ncbi:TSC2 [Bugula neritina]|uniref:TSC2 n=1 Tax=Bugula neritina TaxID=10212 RepID=A0A7J7KGJ8_BUGNE|nr:TSC2 [Bugula neritina]
MSEFDKNLAHPFDGGTQVEEIEEESLNATFLSALKYMRSSQVMSKEKGFGSKLKDLFLGPRTKPVHRNEHHKELVITAEHIQDVSPSSPANNRERRILELTQLVEKYRLEPTAPDALTNAVKDLLQSNDQHKRTVALNFIHAIIRGQDEELGMLRDYYFLLIFKHQFREDQPLLLRMLVTLTKDGHNLSYIDQQIGDLLVQWLNDYSVCDNKKDFLELLVNLIKYNSAFIDEDKAMELFKVY